MAPTITQKAFSAGSDFPPTSPGQLRLYSMRFCPFAHRTRLVLAHKNIPHETVNIDLGSKPDWFLARSAGGLVPTLELDDKVINESTATSDWLDDVYPENKLTPTDPYRKARDRMLMEYFGKMSSVMFAIPGKDAEKLLPDLLKHYKYYEDVLAERGSTFFGGDTPAMIDFFIWPQMERVPARAMTVPGCLVTEDNFPRLAAWYKAMYALPAVKATMFDAETHRHFIETYMAGKPEFDYKI